MVFVGGKEEKAGKGAYLVCEFRALRVLKERNAATAELGSSPVCVCVCVSYIYIYIHIYIDP